MTYKPTIPKQERCCYSVINRMQYVQPALLNNIPKVLATMEGTDRNFDKIEFENNTVVDDDNEDSYLLNVETFEDTIQSNETKQQMIESRKTKCSDSYVLNLLKARSRTKTAHAKITTYKWRCFRFRAISMPDLDL